jgi:hypothetical protein
VATSRGRRDGLRQADVPQPRHTVPQRGPRGRGKVAAEHGGAADLGRRHLRRLGHRVGHHPVQRPVTQFAGQQTTQERLLSGHGAREQAGQ